MNFWNWISLISVALATIILSMDIIRLRKEFVERIGSLAKNVTELRKQHTVLEDKVELLIEPETWKLRDKFEELKAQVDEIPVEQINSVYESERQFQEGLNAIMGFTYEVSKEQTK